MKSGDREDLRRLAAEAILKNLKALAAQIPGVRARRGSEPVHDLRVASRRVRTALRLLDDAEPSKRYRRWNRELKRLASALSRARDTDVQADFLREFLKAHRDARLRPGIAAAAPPASRAPREAAGQSPQGARPLRRARTRCAKSGASSSGQEGRAARARSSGLRSRGEAGSCRRADPQAARQDACVRAVHRAARAAQGTSPHAHRGETLPVHDGGVRAALTAGGSIPGSARCGGSRPSSARFTIATCGFTRRCRSSSPASARGPRSRRSSRASRRCSATAAGGGMQFIGRSCGTGRNCAARRSSNS